MCGRRVNVEKTFAFPLTPYDRNGTSPLAEKEGFLWGRWSFLKLIWSMFTLVSQLGIKSAEKFAH
jgi:hypothetical protein